MLTKSLDSGRLPMSEFRLIRILCDDAVEVANEVGDVWIVDSRFETKTMLQSHRKRVDEVDGCNFAQQILLGESWLLCVLALNNVQPNKTRQISGRQGKLRPVLSSVVVSLVCGGAPERKAKRDDETKNSQQNCVDTCELLVDFSNRKP